MVNSKGNTDNLSPSFQLTTPKGEDRERSVCTRCGFIDYQNPKIIVGSVATDDQERILLCKRAIEPQLGFWTLPAGYLEIGESPERGACREAEEEAGAKLQLDSLLAIYSIERISQVQLIYRAQLQNPTKIAAGVESQAVQLTAYEDIPWADLAFSSVAWALKAWYGVKKMAVYPPFTNPVEGL